MIVYLQLFFGMAAFGSATPISKLVTNAMPVFVGSTLRVAIGALVLMPLVYRKRDQIKQFNKSDWLLTALIALFGMFGFTALMLYGMRVVSGVVGAIVMSTAPAVVAGGSVLFMKDAFNWRKGGAIALAIAGVLVLQLGRLGSEQRSEKTAPMILGVLLVFAAVCCEAAYTLLGKQVSDKRDPVLVACIAAALSLPLFVPFAIWQWPSFDVAHISVSSWLALLWYGAGTLALGTWLWYAGISKTQGSIAAAFMGVMPASALILSYVLLGEAFEWLHLLGFGIVFCGVLLMSWEHARPQAE